MLWVQPLAVALSAGLYTVYYTTPQARLSRVSYLFVVESVDYVFLKNQTGLSWGNLSTHLNKLEEARYVTVEKGYRGKKPRSMIRLTDQGCAAFRNYRNSMQQVLDDLPD